WRTSCDTSLAGFWECRSGSWFSGMSSRTPGAVGDMTDDDHSKAEDRVLAYLAQGRSIGLMDAEHLSYVTGLPVSAVKGALRRLEAKGRVRMGRDGRWALA